MLQVHIQFHHRVRKIHHRVEFVLSRKQWQVLPRSPTKQIWPPDISTSTSMLRPQWDGENEKALKLFYVVPHNKAVRSCSGNGKVFTMVKT